MPGVDNGARLAGVGQPVRVAVHDSRRLISQALADLVGGQPGLLLTSTGTCDFADVADLEVDPPDAVLIGAGARIDPAIEFATGVRARLSGVGIVFVADELEPELVEFVLGDPLSGLVTSDTSAEEIHGWLVHVLHGGTMLPRGWQQAHADVQGDPMSLLSERQMEVLRLLADGLSYGEIADRLFISVNTVKFHVKAIFIGLGVRNRTAAARLLTQRRA